MPGRFELKGIKYMNNLKSDRFQEPRMFTMQQIRNMFFALINQSMHSERTSTAEKRLDDINAECRRLDETDKQM